MTSDRLWRGGDRVEVVRDVSGAAAYFPATVVPSVRKNLVWVEYEALAVRGSVRMKEFVIPTRLRPSPPRELKRSFKAGDEVDVFRYSEGCWVRASVTTVVGNLRYIVEFKGDNRQETEVDRSNLRLHRDWEDGVWVPSHLQQDNNEPKKLKVKIRQTRDHQYKKGDLVEVRSEDEEAYKDSWYCARILCIFDDNKYIVEHLRFIKRDGDESIPLRDLVEANNIRPVPPRELSSAVSYEPGDEVDAWFNKRWWTGRVSKVLGEGSKYSVYFISTGEEPIIPNFNLRPRKDWINGQWVTPSKECYRYEPPWKKLKTCVRAEKLLFTRGMMVEVRSDEQGYEGAWYSAKIISYLGGNRYTVEYQTLKTEDESELLKEEARGSDIRPIPPSLIQKACRYELLENVDAWFHDGWWSGRVYKISSDYTRYGVYFQTTGEKLEFAYSNLRPCQVWREGKRSRA